MPRSAQTSAMVSLSPGRSEVRVVMSVSLCAGMGSDIGPFGCVTGPRSVFACWSRLGLPVCLPRIGLPRGELLVPGQVDLRERGGVALEPVAQLRAHPRHERTDGGSAFVGCVVGVLLGWLFLHGGHVLSACWVGGRGLDAASWRVGAAGCRAAGAWWRILGPLVPVDRWPLRQLAAVR